MSPDCSFSWIPATRCEVLYAHRPFSKTPPRPLPQALPAPRNRLAAAPSNCVPAVRKSPLPAASAAPSRSPIWGWQTSA